MPPPFECRGERQLAIVKDPCLPGGDRCDERASFAAAEALSSHLNPECATTLRCPAQPSLLLLSNKGRNQGFVKKKANVLDAQGVFSLRTRDHDCLTD